MNNVVRFPRATRPVPPSEEALTRELTLVEIEIARYRLARLRDDARRDQAAWAWSGLKRAAFWGGALWLLATMFTPAKAESVSKSFYNSNGSFAGSSIRRGNSGSYYDGAGRFSGSSVTRGNSTSYYDNAGRYSGSTIDRGPRR